jgi:hypothetical protein
VIVIENKLWEPWHDRDRKSQEETCRECALKKADPNDAIGLIFLSAYQAYDERREGWVFLQWRDLARGLRGELRSIWTKKAASPSELIPIVLTISAIERHLLGFEASLIENEDMNLMRLSTLERLVQHLSEARDGI